MNAGTTFGRWLRQRRKSLDLTQAELARRVACSTAAIRKIEAGQRRPSKQIAERLAQLLGVPPGERPAFVSFARANIPADLAAPASHPAGRRRGASRPIAMPPPRKFAPPAACPLSSPA